MSFFGAGPLRMTFLIVLNFTLYDSFTSYYFCFLIPVTRSIIASRAICQWWKASLSLR